MPSIQILSKLQVGKNRDGLDIYDAITLVSFWNYTYLNMKIVIRINYIYLYNYIYIDICEETLHAP